MTVFKTFIKVLNKCKIPIILYTVFLIAFGGFNMKTSDNNMTFEAEKPNILIVNNDEEVGITKSLINYIKENSNIVEIKNNEEARNDALFYREVNYIIYIPKNYRELFLTGKNPTIEIKSTNDYQASYAEMLLNRYLKVINLYNNMSEEEIIEKTNETLKKQVKIEITSKLDNNLEKSTYYYNFLSYSMLAGSIYVICLILASFKDEKINKRTIISSMNYKKHNKILLLSNILFVTILWIIYVILSIILCGKVMISTHGLIYMLNSLIFTICSVTIAFLINSLINNKNAISGIVNVVALGSSFLCGAFVPSSFLPKSVLALAHILPSYWYIKTNDTIKTLETIDVVNLKPIFINMSVLLIFSLIFIILSNLITKKKLKK